MSIFVFEENNKPIGLVKLEKVAAAEANWLDKYIYVYFEGIEKPAMFHFESEKQLIFEFHRLTVNLEPLDYNQKSTKPLRTQQ